LDHAKEQKILHTKLKDPFCSLPETMRHMPMAVNCRSDRNCIAIKYPKI